MSDPFKALFGDPAELAIVKLQLTKRDLEVAELERLVTRLKRKAQNNIDRAYNRGVRDARAEECSDGTCVFRVVRYAEEFGRD